MGQDNSLVSRLSVSKRVTGYLRSAPTTGGDDATTGARAVFSRRQRWMLLLGFALLVIFRLPLTWTHGRFVGEEATVFLAYAWHRPWLDALFRPFAGYWNFAASATTTLVVALVKGGILPLERAPYVTMIVALAVQLQPAVLILTGRAQWLAGRPAVIAALLIIAIAPATEEVFLNVLHIQFHLALCAALILALDVPRGRFATVGYATLLFLAPLCGPSVIVILPLFALRGVIDRDVGRLMQLAALVAGAATQLLLFYGSNPLRGYSLDPATIAAAMFVRMIAAPLFGFAEASKIGSDICISQLTGGIGWRVVPAATVALFGLLIIQAARRRDAAIWLVLSSLSIAGVTIGFGMIITNRYSPFALAAERYNFLPLVLLGLALAALAMRSHSRSRLVYVLLCSPILITGAIQYRKPLVDYDDGPSWAAEVSAWRHDHRHPMAVWPRPWAADLSDEMHTCSPIGRDLRRSTDPRYCDSRWVADMINSR